MIKKLIIAMLAICASVCVFTSCGDDDDDKDNKNNVATTTWAKVVEKNPWLKIFPEVQGSLVEASVSSGGMQNVSVSIYGKDETFLNNYLSKIGAMKGFEDTFTGTGTYWGEDANGNQVCVTGTFAEASGEKVVMISFVNYGEKL